MKTLVIVAHPQLADSTTQAFLKAGIDLTDADRQTIESVSMSAIQAATRVVFQFPLLWYQAPASLSAWLSTIEPTVLAHKELGVVVTLGRPLRDYTPGGAVGVSLDSLLSPFVALANTVGAHYLPAFVVAQFAYMDDAARGKLLIAYQQYLTLPQPQHFDQVANWWLDRLPEGTMKAEIAARQAQLESLQQALEADNG